jgi:hypothetical protein
MLRPLRPLWRSNYWLLTANFRSFYIKCRTLCLAPRERVMPMLHENGEDFQNYSGNAAQFGQQSK